MFFKKHLQIDFFCLTLQIHFLKNRPGNEKDIVCLSREYMPKSDGGIRDERLGEECRVG